VESVGRGGGEIRQQREPLGLRQDRAGPGLGSLRAPNIYRAKGPDSNEPGHRWFCVQYVTRRVTARGRFGDGGTAYCAVNLG
jgi:hypothetical protein